MCALYTRLSRRVSARARRTAVITITTTLLALLSGSQAVPALASTTVTPLPAGEVEKALSGIPLKDVSATQLSEALSRLPGLSALPASQLREALTKTIEGIAAKGDTLGQLTESGTLAPGLEGQLKKALSVIELLSILKGQSLSSVLSESLGSLDSNQMVAELLSSTASPEKLIGEVLATVEPGELESLLGTTLTGEPFIKSTAGELAREAGTTTEGFAQDFNTTTSQLPASAMALTAPLSDGKTLGVLDAVDGLDFGVLGSPTEGASEKSGGSGESGNGSGGSSGGSGSGPGGSGSGSGASGSGSGNSGSGSGGSGNGSGDQGGTLAGASIVVNNLPAPDVTVVGSSVKPAGAAIKILSRKVNGTSVTLVVQVPAAGRLALTGRGVRSVSKQAEEAERVTLRTALTKARAGSLRGHRRDVKVKLEASFREVGGASASATTTVVLR